MAKSELPSSSEDSNADVGRSAEAQAPVGGARRRSLKSLFRTRSRELARELTSLERAVDLPSTLLIIGESGTGKDRLARAVHDASDRRQRPFIRIDAANLSD